MKRMANNSQFCGRTRREFLWEMGGGFVGVALAGLLQRDGFAFGALPTAAPSANPLALRQSHFPAKAKSVIFLFMYGGPSQMDLFDYKPDLQKRDGQTVEMEIRRRDVRPSKLLASKRKFAKYGKSGLWCSDALPQL